MVDPCNMPRLEKLLEFVDSSRNQDVGFPYSIAMHELMDGSSYMKINWKIPFFTHLVRLVSFLVAYGYRRLGFIYNDTTLCHVLVDLFLKIEWDQVSSKKKFLGISL